MTEVLKCNGVSAVYRVINMPGDGACMFHFLSYTMHGHLHMSMNIRLAIVAHVLANWCRFQPYTFAENGDPFPSMEVYQAAMLLPKTYGTYSELHAAGELYPFQFQVYQEGSLLWSCGEDGQPVKKLRFAGNLNSGHFDVYEAYTPVVRLTRLPEVTVINCGQHCSSYVPSPIIGRPKKLKRGRKKIKEETKIDMLKKENKRKKEARENESAEIKDARLRKNRNSMKEAKDKETAKKRNVRLRKKRINMREARKKETVKKKEAYLKKNNNKMKETRENEMKQKRSRRLSERNKRDASRRKRILNAETDLNIKIPAKLNIGYQIATPAFDEGTVKEHSCGDFNVTCQFCYSLNFDKELPPDGKFSRCCQKGKVVLESFKPFPDLLHNLMTGSHLHSKNFMENIRSYNSSLGFASMGANIASPKGLGPYCFKIHGQIYHRTGTLHPPEGKQRKYAQLYILDAGEATNQRMNILENEGCLPELMSELGILMTLISPFAQAYKMLNEVEKEANHEAGGRFSSVMMAIRQDRKSDPRRYNAPQVNEVAVIFQNADGEPPLERDLLIHLRPNTNNPDARVTKRISVLDKNLEPMLYPILFPYGDQGWGLDLCLKDAKKRDRMTQMHYYGHRLAIQKEFNLILNAGKLTQQFFVDAYVKTEANRLNFIKQNQTKLRVEFYKGLLDHLNSDAEKQGLLPLKPVILSSSFQGSPRNMIQNYQDAMAIVRKFGKPDLFITMTCNPKWLEITENLAAWQKTEHRPDLVARVFNLKLKALLVDICEKHILGVLIAKLHVIEFQKRGLPHAHILIILKADKPNNREIINKLVCAEIPCLETSPRLHQIVLKHMIHGPCGASNPNSPCMVDGICSKGFPKMFQEETLNNIDGYLLYRRREDERTFKVGTKDVDYKWVVPYNLYISLRYNCHINVEVCCSIKSVKYLYKYVYKGHDCANVEIQEKQTGILEHNEVTSFMDSRYVSAPEAAWHLFGFRMHEQSHTIVSLQVHLPDQQSVCFNPDRVIDAVNAAAVRETTLTAWFNLNKVDVSAKQYHYTEILEFYRFDKNKWKPRQRGGNLAIGRMYAVSVADTERYYLRVLLLHVPGATSFVQLRTVGSITYSSFQEAARLRGLLDDDAVWESTLCEASAASMPSQLRQTFALICIFGTPADVQKLWFNHKQSMQEDFARHHTGHTESCILCENNALRDVQNTLILHGKQCKNFGLRIPPPATSNQWTTSFNV